MFVLLLLALGSAREVAIVVATLPLAFAGGLFALWLAGETWNASSIVGVIGLFGVAVQNSLVLITQTRSSSPAACRSQRRCARRRSAGCDRS